VRYEQRYEISAAEQVMGNVRVKILKCHGPRNVFNGKLIKPCFGCSSLGEAKPTWVGIKLYHIPKVTMIHHSNAKNCQKFLIQTPPNAPIMIDMDCFLWI
jgi:hypothetical protein